MNTVRSKLVVTLLGFSALTILTVVSPVAAGPSTCTGWALDGESVPATGQQVAQAADDEDSSGIDSEEEPLIFEEGEEEISTEAAEPETDYWYGSDVADDLDGAPAAPGTAESDQGGPSSSTGGETTAGVSLVGTQSAEEAAPEGAPAQRITLAVQSGYGRLSEETIDQTAEMLSVGLEFQWYPKAWLGVLVPFLADAYHRQYRALGAGGSTGLPLIEEEEWRFDTGAAVAFDVLHKAGYGEGWLTVGGRYFYFLNGSFAEHVAGVITGALFNLPIIDDLGVRIFCDYTYNLLSLLDEDEEGLVSITGRPIASLRFGGGLWLAIGDSNSLSIVYRGEHIPYDHSDLLIHRAMLETSFSFSF